MCVYAPELTQCFEDGSEELRGRSANVAGLHEARLALKVADQAAGLLDEESARRHVPGRKAQLPEGVEPPAGDVSEIQRRGPGAAHAGAGLHEGPELPGVEVEAAHFLERKAGADE